MPAAGSPGDAGAEIRGRLAEVAASLEQGDAPGAALAVGRLAAACDAAATAGARIDADALAELGARLGRCTALAAKARDVLATTLRALGTGHRAHRAYQQPDE